MPTISLQMYSVDEAFTKDPAGTLARLRETGFTTVEAFNFVHRAEDLATAFAEHGLSATTGHAFLTSQEVLLPDGTTLSAPAHEDVWTAAKRLGLTTVIDPYTHPSRWETAEQIAETARALNAAAAEAAHHGLRVGYHNHGHELAAQVDGTSGLEYLADLLDPGVVFEVDLYWAVAGGADLTALLHRLGERVIAVHVKDGPLPGDATTTQVPAGQGDVPLIAGLNAVKALEYSVIEFDGYNGDVLDAVAQSFTFLRDLGHSAD